MTKKLEYEALTLLVLVDATLEEKNHGRDFDGKRIAIETTIELQG